MFSGVSFSDRNAFTGDTKITSIEKQKQVSHILIVSFKYSRQ